MAPSLLRFALIALLALTAMSQSDTTGDEMTTTGTNDGSTTDGDAVSVTLADSPSSDAPEPPSTPGVPLDWIKRGGPIDDTTSTGPTKVYKEAPVPSPKKATKKKAAAKKMKKKNHAIKKMMASSVM